MFGFTILCGGAPLMKSEGRLSWRGPAELEPGTYDPLVGVDDGGGDKRGDVRIAESEVHGFDARFACDMPGGRYLPERILREAQELFEYRRASRGFHGGGWVGVV